MFKHALVQDTAYGTLLREPRRALHARIADTLKSQFAEIAERRPELLARHCTEAGLMEEAAGLWGKAGQRSLERSALVEAVAQLTCALGQIAALAATPSLRREAIKLQVAPRRQIRRLADDRLLLGGARADQIAATASKGGKRTRRGGSRAKAPGERRLGASFVGAADRPLLAQTLGSAFAGFTADFCPS